MMEDDSFSKGWTYMDYVLITSIGALGMAIFALFVRMKAAKSPVTPKKIIIPPIAMSTGALMFIFPYFRVTPIEIVEASLAGLFFSIFLIKTSKFEIRGNEIYMQRSKAFLYILVTLLIIRIIAKLVLSVTIDVGTLGGMFWILAFSMIVPWRIAMYIKYQKIKQQLQPEVSMNMGD